MGRDYKYVAGGKEVHCCGLKSIQSRGRVLGRSDSYYFTGQEFTGIYCWWKCMNDAKEEG